MISLEQILLLEKKVESAVAKIAQLQAENDALRSKCSELTNALSSKSEQLSSFEQDQNRIENGILKALDRLSSIENTILTAASAPSSFAQKEKIQNNQNQASGLSENNSSEEITEEAAENEDVSSEENFEETPSEPETTSTENIPEENYSNGNFSNSQVNNSEETENYNNPVQTNYSTSPFTQKQFYDMNDATSDSGYPEENGYPEESEAPENDENGQFDIF